MSAEAETIDDTSMCASCGNAAKDDVKLKNCTACHLVKYCGVKCQREHRPQHKRECRKRAAELHDEILFKQPESSHLGDCPICCLPLSLVPKTCIMMACCSKMICNGCDYASVIRKIDDKCPFCRHPTPENEEETDKDLMKRVEANDPVAVRNMGFKRYNDEGDNESAIEYLTKAAELGDLVAHFELANFYRDGECVGKDMKKVIYHSEQAAIGGHPMARYNLGCVEEENGRFERAVKHWIIAANLGDDKSLNALKKGYAVGRIQKEDFAAALRAHQAALDAAKSPQREAAEAARLNNH
ncbi:Sel1-like repeat family protein [Skeletonema marinoi]|uniref:Sel1-like repeat family protein n=1 Tax=Skeletonema marinoi TaxID=267567 RepID=A0AAD8Y9C0_9STRA|nr:Sel1-like repeat family protein [Skeletonema marinoi]